MLFILLFTIAIGTLSAVLFVKRNRKAGSSSGSGGTGLVNSRSKVEVAAEADSSCRSIEDLELVIANQLSNLDSSISDDKLLEYKEQLQGTVRNGLREAVRLWDHSTILRLIKLLKLLGLEEEGLKVFVDYLKNVVSTRYMANLKQLHHSNERPNSDSEVNPVTCVTYLSLDIVSAINGNYEILRYLGGEEGIVYAVSELQEECDLWASNMLNVFPYREYFWKMHTRMEMYEFQDKYSSGEKRMMDRRLKEGPLEPQAIDVYVQGMISLAHLSQDYEKMMSMTLMDDPQLCWQASSAVSHGYSSRVSSAIISRYYFGLEMMYMENGVMKAIWINEDVQDNHISSMVDDTFYVLWTSCQRAISTSNGTLVEKVILHAVCILKTVYTDAVMPRMHWQTRIRFVTNYEDSIKNVLELQRRIEEALPKLDMDGITYQEICYDKLEGVRRHFEQYLGDVMDEHRNTTNSQIESILGSVKTTDTDGEAILYDDANPWVQRLIKALENNVAWLKPKMSAKNYESFMYPIVQFIAERLPGIISTLNFSKGGHEKLRREMIELVSLISRMIPEWRTEGVPNIGVEQIVATVKPRIELVLQSVETIDSAYDEDNPWVERLIDFVVINVAWLEPLMTATHYDALVYSIIVFIVTRLPDGIFMLRSSEGGHQQLLRDISKLASQLSSLTRRSTDDLLDILMEKLAATVIPRIRPCVETISSSFPGWLQRLLDALNTNVAWVETLMKPSHYNTFVYVVIDFIVTRLDRIIISVEFSEGEQVQLRRDMKELTIHVSSMCGRPMRTQLSTLKHLSCYEPPLMWRCPT